MKILAFLRVLWPVLSCCTLTKMMLAVLSGGNDLGDAGAMYIAAALKDDGCMLRSIGLGGNGMFVVTQSRNLRKNKAVAQPRVDN